jgi:hypothetical protein
MKKIGLVAVISLLMMAQNAWSYGTGISSFPLVVNKPYVGAEFTGITSTGGGVGMQARYTQKLSSSTVVDAGLGMGGGEMTSRIFGGVDFELFPDYQKQPKISIKAKYENAEEFEVRTNSFGIAPTVTKGFNFWGHEAYPFVSLPYNVQLDAADASYNTTASLNLGIAANLPWDGYRHLTATAEGVINLSDSYSGLFVGVSFPFNN